MILAIRYLHRRDCLKLTGLGDDLIPASADTCGRQVGAMCVAECCEHLVEATRGEVADDFSREIRIVWSARSGLPLCGNWHL
jgi:hypothetical protein